MTKPRVRKGPEYVALTREEFERRFREHFFDPAFEPLGDELRRIVDIAYDGYLRYRKSPRTRPAGPGFHDRSRRLPVEWLAARDAIRAAERRRADPTSRSRILVVNGSSRSPHSCPGEISKTYRLARLAEEVIVGTKGFEVDFLDLSLLTSEYGRKIYPCKACVATAMPLCHWPCSCYPNHAMNQTGDWMNELYPRWAAAHGVMVLTSVNWYQAPSVLKLMIDRLVCADGGNPDPTLTNGKDPLKAKQVELKGWHYPKHLAGRAFGAVVHGDAAGVENLRRILCDWLTDLGMVQAGPSAALGTYIGYYQPYATSHDDLDRDTAVQEEVRNAATSVVNLVRMMRTGEWRAPDEGLESSREK